MFTGLLPEINQHEALTKCSFCTWRTIRMICIFNPWQYIILNIIKRGLIFLRKFAIRRDNYKCAFYGSLGLGVFLGYNYAPLRKPPSPWCVWAQHRITCGVVCTRARHANIGWHATVQAKHLGHLLLVTDGAWMRESRELLGFFIAYLYPDTWMIMHR